MENMTLDYSKINAVQAMEGMDINYVGIEKIPLDLEYFYDVSTGRGLRLTSVESFDKKNQKIFTGLQSEFFGTDFSSDWAFKERYSCKCGKCLGKRKKNVICDECGTKVEYHDIDLTKTGWIVLDYHHVMSPIYSAKLAEALGKVDGEYVLKRILKRRYHEEGIPDYTEKELLILKKHPFILKGMTWLKDNLMEVLEFYEKRKPGKRKLFAELKAERHMIFTQATPVYTSLLRTELPGEKGNKNFKLKINTHLKSLIRVSNAINDYEDNRDYDAINTIDIFLAGMQAEIDVIFELCYKDLTAKTGIISSKVLGGRYNFSTRNIIVPNSGVLRSDEVIMGYIPFMELFRYELQNLYRKLYEVTPAKANSAWKNALNHFDPKYYAIIESMLTDPKMKKYLAILINRNPSINYGSFMYMRIVGVHKDIADKTLVVSTHIIAAMNADFDGDLINGWRLIGEDMQKRFAKNLNPRYNMFISRMDGKCNPEFVPAKDELTAMWAFNNM